MYSEKHIVKIVGILFITATVTSSLSIWLSEPVLEAKNLLEMFSHKSSEIAWASLLMLMDAISVAFIAILLFPILKKKSESLALGYVGMRIMESILFVIYVVVLLTILSISNEYSASTIQDSSTTIGPTLLILAKWTFDIGLGIIFTISALLLNYTLFRFALVPRWLSAWGFLGALVTMIIVLLKFYNNIHVTEVLDFIIGIQEMVFAIWLIAKGLDINHQKQEGINV
ncbi:DUF4386 domain-containing protein [Ekhidna sp.]